MKKFLYLIIFLPFLLAACDVHEWPESPDSVKFHLRLNYETDMTEWHHMYDGYSVMEQGYGETYDNYLGNGQVRYIVRAYPVVDKNRSTQEHIREFTFSKNISDGYNHEVTLELPGGNYQLMVWSDFVKSGSQPYFHDATNFTEVVLQGEHQGNTDYRDAFRGVGNIKLVADVVEYIPDTLDVTMQRPVAKYEFITTDLQEFIKEEIDYLSKVAASRGEEAPSRVNIEDYKVIIQYPGYMPNAFNMHLDKPVDAADNVSFESVLDVLNDTEASLGFDYVYTDTKQSAVTVQIAVYDKTDRLLASAEPINVPLNRDCHTVLRGSFLVQKASGGIVIQPGFDGDHNIVIP